MCKTTRFRHRLMGAFTTASLRRFVLPILGHLFVGAGIGTASGADPRSRLLRRTWLGIAVLLAYLPDLMEWIGRLAGWRFPHAAPASIGVTLLNCGLFLALMRWVFRETNRVVLFAGAVAIWSHPLLDLVDGGIPLLWPLSSTNVGPDWLGWGERSRAVAALRECVLFSPVLGAGLVIALWRSRPHRYVTWSAAILFILTVDGSLLTVAIPESRVACVASASVGLTGLLLLTVLVRRPRVRPVQVVLALAPCLPIMMLGGVELYAWGQMRRGLDLEWQGDSAAAAAYYVRVRRLMPVDLQAAALCRLGHCYRRMGREEAAYQAYIEGIDENPNSLDFLRGLAHLHMVAKQPELHQPREALRLAEEVVRRARTPEYRDQVAVPLLRRAREAVRRFDAGSAEPSPGHR